jgi:predicted Holliday junction resolvase-like endonuclease
MTVLVLGIIANLLTLAVILLEVGVYRLRKKLRRARRELDSTNRTLAAYRAMEDRAITDFLAQNEGLS